MERPAGLGLRGEGSEATGTGGTFSGAFVIGTFTGS